MKWMLMTFMVSLSFAEVPLFCDEKLDIKISKTQIDKKHLKERFTELNERYQLQKKLHTQLEKITQGIHNVFVTKKIVEAEVNMLEKLRYQIQKALAYQELFERPKEEVYAKLLHENDISDWDNFKKELHLQSSHGMISLSQVMPHKRLIEILQNVEHIHKIYTCAQCQRFDEKLTEKEFKGLQEFSTNIETRMKWEKKLDFAIENRILRDHLKRTKGNRRKRAIKMMIQDLYEETSYELDHFFASQLSPILDERQGIQEAKKQATTEVMSKLKSKVKGTLNEDCQAMIENPLKAYKNYGNCFRVHKGIKKLYEKGLLSKLIRVAEKDLAQEEKVISIYQQLISLYEGRHHCPNVLIKKIKFSKNKLPKIFGNSNPKK